MAFPLYPATERQKRFVAIAGELADTFAKRAQANEWEGRFPVENYRDLHESGYLALTVPRDFGGEGADALETTLAQARLAQGCASTALVTSMHLSTIARIGAGIDGPNPLYEHICRAVVHDGALINGAASEPSTGSPSRGGKPSTTARRLADGSWVINGRKTFTTGSPVLHFFLVSCSMILADGLLNFAPAAQARLGAWGFPITAVYLGIAQGARNEAVRFARRRRPNSLDKPISSVPHIQEKVAQMELLLLQSEAVLFGLAEQFLRDAKSIPDSQFAACKYLVTNHAVEITDLAMRLVGGAGLSLNLPLQRYYRDVRAGLHHPPMDDVTLALLSKQALEAD